MKANLRTWIRQKFRDVVDDDETRYRMQLGWVFRILTLVVLVMIVVNTLTREFGSIPAMAEVVRRVIGSDGEISRWGGEEFAVLMNRAEGARDMAEAMRAAVAAMRVPSGSETVHTTVSIGLTVCPALPVEKERLLTLTDQCLYRAKKAVKTAANGRNTRHEPERNMKTGGVPCPVCRLSGCQGLLERSTTRKITQEVTAS